MPLAFVLFLCLNRKYINVICHDRLHTSWYQSFHKHPFPPSCFYLSSIDNTESPITSCGTQVIIVLGIEYLPVRICMILAQIHHRSFDSTTTDTQGISHIHLLLATKGPGRSADMSNILTPFGSNIKEKVSCSQSTSFRAYKPFSSKEKPVRTVLSIVEPPPVVPPLLVGVLGVVPPLFAPEVLPAGAADEVPAAPLFTPVFVPVPVPALLLVPPGVLLPVLEPPVLVFDPPVLCCTSVRRPPITLPLVEG